MGKKKYEQPATFEFRIAQSGKLIGFESLVFTNDEPFDEHTLGITIMKHQQRLLDEEIECIVSDEDKSEELLKEYEETKKKDEYTFNINERVKVKLTDIGYEHLIKIYNQDLPPSMEEADLDYFKKQEDENGYISFQLWELMEVFGAPIGAGLPNHFETDIKIESKFLK